MKFTIDTENKTISISEDCNIKDLVKFLKKSIPDWEEYSISRTVECNQWWYPVYQPPYTIWPITSGDIEITTASNTTPGAITTFLSN